MDERVMVCRGRGSAWRGRIVRVVKVVRAKKARMTSAVVEDVETGEVALLPFRCLRKRHEELPYEQERAGQHLL